MNIREECDMTDVGSECQRTCWVMEHGPRVVRLAMEPRQDGQGFSIFIYDTHAPDGRYADTTAYPSAEAVTKAAADLQHVLMAMGWKSLPLA
jgi:hypothetical protein